MKKSVISIFIFAVNVMLLVSACGNESDLSPTTTSGTTTSTTTTTANATTSLEIFKKIYGATEVYLEGNYAIIKTNGLPVKVRPR